MALNLALTNDYRILVSRAQTRPSADVYLFSFRDPIPTIPIPLLPEDSELTLPLNDILHNLYDTIGLDLRIDYTQPPSPGLSDEETNWVTNLLANSEA